MKAMLKAAGMIACLAFVVNVDAQAFIQTTNPIKGSDHDFTVSYLGASGQGATTLCSTCHEMHKPKKMEPLWARKNPAAGNWVVNSHGTPTPLPSVYTPNAAYVGTGNAVTDPLNYKTGSLIAMSDFLDSKSGLCLSCHDGSQPVANGLFISGDPTVTSANFGQFDLSKNHALGKERGGTYYGSTDVVPAGILALNDTVKGTDGVTRYFLGCTSCHGIHTSPLGNPKFLLNDYVTNSGPVCWNCHRGK